MCCRGPVRIVIKKGFRPLWCALVVCPGAGNGGPEGVSGRSRGVGFLHRATRFRVPELENVLAYQNNFRIFTK